MAMKKQIYKCELCGNIVEVLTAGDGKLFCCGKEMKLLEEKSADSAIEKHVPIIEKSASGYKVIVGSTLHPMLENHYIEWIELIADGVSYRRFMKPGERPEAEFCVKADKVSAREYCNVHGLWKN